MYIFPAVVKDEELIEVTTRGSVTKPAGDVSTRRPTGSGEVDQEGQEEGSGFVGAYIISLTVGSMCWFYGTLIKYQLLHDT